MGFLLFADALGIQALLARDPVLASLAIAKIGDVAVECLDHGPPGGGAKPGEAPGAQLLVFNDCFYFYCNELAPMVHYASQTALNLFLASPDRGGPIRVARGRAKLAVEARSSACVRMSRRNGSIGEERYAVPRVSLNDLRRTFATLQARGGIAREDLVRAMGHSDDTMLRRVYDCQRSSRPA